MAMEVNKWVGDFKLAPGLLFLVITCLSCSMIPALSVNNNIYHDAATLESYPEYVTLHKSRDLHGTVHMSAHGTGNWKAGWREGFGMELVHMDSPSSPFAKRDASRAELHSQLLNRESARTHALGKHISHVHSKPKSSKAGGAGAPAGTSLKDPVTSGLNSGTGEYFVTLQVWPLYRRVLCNSLIWDMPRMSEFRNTRMPLICNGYMNCTLARSHC